MLWSMGRSQLSYGLLIDAGTYVRITNGRIEVFGISPTSTPAILIDARNAQWVDFPQFHRPGKPNAVQNAALIGATLHILRSGDTSVTTDVREDAQSVPRTFKMEQNYPNPFNPTTTIRFSVARSGLVSLKIYDVLGREVSTLLDGSFSGGVYEARWDASGNASGVYFARLNQVADGSIQSATSKLLLSK
jgi:hypothetical protein